MSLPQMQTVPFTTRRPPPKVGGRQAAPAPYLVATDLRCTPLNPADSATHKLMREQLDRQVRVLETYTAATADIADGDLLVVDGRDYPVRRAERWDWRRTIFLRLLVEDL